MKSALAATLALLALSGPASATDIVSENCANMAAAAAGALSELEGLFAALKQTDHTEANLYLPAETGRRMERLNEARDAMLPTAFAYLDELTAGVESLQECARG